jgi:hypothetical protein
VHHLPCQRNPFSLQNESSSSYTLCPRVALQNLQYLVVLSPVKVRVRLRVRVRWLELGLGFYNLCPLGTFQHLQCLVALSPNQIRRNAAATKAFKEYN